MRASKRRYALVAAVAAAFVVKARPDLSFATEPLLHPLGVFLP